MFFFFPFTETFQRPVNFQVRAFEIRPWAAAADHTANKAAMVAVLQGTWHDFRVRAYMYHYLSLLNTPYLTRWIYVYH